MRCVTLWLAIFLNANWERKIGFFRPKLGFSKNKTLIITRKNEELASVELTWRSQWPKRTHDFLALPFSDTILLFGGID